MISFYVFYNNLEISIEYIFLLYFCAIDITMEEYNLIIIENIYSELNTQKQNIIDENKIVLNIYLNVTQILECYIIYDLLKYIIKNLIFINHNCFKKNKKPYLTII